MLLATGTSTEISLLLVLQGKGHGRIRVKATYWPFQMIYSKPRKATMVHPPRVPF